MRWLLVALLCLSGCSFMLGSTRERPGTCGSDLAYVGIDAAAGTAAFGLGIATLEGAIVEHRHSDGMRPTFLALPLIAAGLALVASTAHGQHIYRRCCSATAGVSGPTWKRL